MEVKLRDGSSISLNEAQIAQACQYSGSYGLDELVVLLKNLQKRIHNVPYKSDTDWGIMVSNGSQDSLFKAFDLLLSPGDSVLVEDPTYSGALAALIPMGLNLVGIPVDSEGLIPERLDTVLQNWDQTNSTPTPKVLYTIPTGQNPSGLTLSNKRRKQVYAIASKHDLIILEDDPYWNLRFTDQKDPLESFISQDVDGRVLRFDSFSKTLSAGRLGMRIGWTTGPQPLVEKMQLIQQASGLHASGISQAILLQLLKTWGDEGLDKHVLQVREFYTKKKNDFLSLCEKYLSPEGLAVWESPTAGMFVWFQIPGVADTSLFVSELAKEAKVLMVPGQAFSPSGKPSSYVRAAFSTATYEEMEEALKRFSELLLKLKKGPIN